MAQWLMGMLGTSGWINNVFVCVCVVEANKLTQKQSI